MRLINQRKFNSNLQINQYNSFSLDMVFDEEFDRDLDHEVSQILPSGYKIVLLIK